MSVSRVYVIFLLLGLLIVGFLAWMFWYNESMFWSTLPELIASFLSGILGIVLGFEIDRRHESSQQQKRIEFTLKFLRDELELIYGQIDTLRTRIDKGEECFILFNTTTWKRFGSQLDSFKDLQFVLNLGYFYWELDQLNEAMKKSSIASDLKEFYAYHPPFQGVNDLLEHLKKATIANQSYIQDYLFEN